MLLTENNRINKKFSSLEAKGEKALICYIVGGYPSLLVSEKIISSLVQGGADIIEVGIPFSDPIADGPTIQKASFEALAKGITVDKCLKLMHRLRKKFPELPLLAMTYSNIPFKAGYNNFLGKLKMAGIDGLILPDMAIEESESYARDAKSLDLATVFLVSPNTSNDRIKKIISQSSGFTYVVSVLGTTGARTNVSNYSVNAVERIRKIAGPNKKIAVGFGISLPSHVKSFIDAGADAVIVGSSIVDKINRTFSHRQLENELKLYAKTMKYPCKL
jgi:tryptophan synthase alpha chain